MSKEQRIKLRLVTEPMPKHNEIRVCVPSIEYDETLDCFYVTSADPATIQSHDLPANLHTKELLNLDPSDVDALLAFQREWGLVTTPKRTPLRFDALGTDGSVIATPQVGKTIEECTQEANALLDQLDARHPGFKKVCGMLTMTTTPSNHGMYTFVPHGEAEAAVTWLQSRVNELVRFSCEGYDPWAGIDEINLRSRIDEIDSAISPYFPRVRLASEKTMDGTVKALPTTIALLVQLVRYISSEEGYRVCQNPKCKCYFVYKRHSPGELVQGKPARNRLSDYCSDDCQRRASAIRQAVRRKEKRHELKAERLRKEGR